MTTEFVSDTTPELLALLAAVAADPERDAPRLILADWLEERSDPRAALIRIQCQWARLSDNSPKERPLREQEQEWLGQHLGDWLGVRQYNKAFSIRLKRGFIQLYTEGAWLAKGKIPPKVRRAIEAGWVSQVHFRKCTNAQLSQIAQKGLLGRVTELILSGTQVSDRGLTALAGLDRLRVLSLSKTKITDTTLTLVRALKGLRRLELAHTKATGAPLGGAGASCKRLEELSLAGSPVTDSVLAGFGELTKLRVLDLSGTKITDQGLKVLAKLTNLKELGLGWTRVSGHGLEYLAELDRLQSLELNHTDVSGGIALLGGLPRLRRLNLEGTAVDEDAVEYLAGMKLRYLNLRATRVPQSSAWDLESELRGCEIICD